MYVASFSSFFLSPPPTATPALAPELVDLMNDIYKNYWNPLQNRKFRVEIRISTQLTDEVRTPSLLVNRFSEFSG